MSLSQACGGVVDFRSFMYVLEEDAERVRNSRESLEVHPAGAEVHPGSAGFFGTTKVTPCYKAVENLSRNELFRNLESQPI
jgi:hypothetical protein